MFCRFNNLTTELMHTKEYTQHYKLQTLKQYNPSQKKKKRQEDSNVSVTKQGTSTVPGTQHYLAQKTSKLKIINLTIHLLKS